MADLATLEEIEDNLQHADDEEIQEFPADLSDTDTEDDGADDDNGGIK